jgi:predicted lipid-binding transport protein (Tim44 family)
MMKIWTLVVSLALVMGSVTAEAKRLGGGSSVGKQSSNVSKREATPAVPAQNVAKPAATPAPAAPAAQPAKRPWGAMLGGLAAGLGLAWLAHSLGMGEGFGQFMMIALAVLLVMMAIGWFMRNRRPAVAQNNSPFAFQGAGAGGVVTPTQYKPQNVGNDASARPWESPSTQFDSTNAKQNSGVVIGSALGGAQSWGVPSDFDTQGFLKAAKANFVTLQAAWDKSDISALRVMMTDEMLREIQSQLADRETHTGGSSNHTDVEMLEAQLLGIEDLGSDYMASVEYSGMIREEPSAGPSPFREVWNMTKPKNGSRGWLVAGVQALQ